MQRAWSKADVRFGSSAPERPALTRHWMGEREEEIIGMPDPPERVFRRVSASHEEAGDTVLLSVVHQDTGSQDGTHVPRDAWRVSIMQRTQRDTAAARASSPPTRAVSVQSTVATPRFLSVSRGTKQPLLRDITIMGHHVPVRHKLSGQHQKVPLCWVAAPPTTCKRTVPKYGILHVTLPALHKLNETIQWNTADDIAIHKMSRPSTPYSVSVRIQGWIIIDRDWECRMLVACRILANGPSTGTSRGTGIPATWETSTNETSDVGETTADSPRGRPPGTGPLFRRFTWPDRLLLCRWYDRARPPLRLHV
ncbi:hypothetical protein GGR56DRAFT_324819 [Xylariaceae sp. FL0804]|nr:hypothetical protein GGR56DRAFT_324819 [Xylariaceae sp. FL0804]